jgi:hypothetical protein
LLERQLDVERLPPGRPYHRSDGSRTSSGRRAPANLRRAQRHRHPAHSDGLEDWYKAELAKLESDNQIQVNVVTA